jgi:pilus assembly protein CpaB
VTRVLSWSGFLRAVAVRRRAATALLTGLAVLCAVSAVRPAAPPSVVVLAAARDLAPGVALALPDLARVALPAAAVPTGALRPGAAVLGRLVAGPVRRGEPLTDVRLLGPPLVAAVAGGADAVAVPVRFADAGAVALLHPGDRIDVLATPADTAARPDPLAAPRAPDAGPSAAPGAATGNASGGPGGPGAGPGAAYESGGAAAGDGAARVVAADVAVLLVATGDGTSFDGGALVVVACTPAVARALAAAAAGERLSPALRAPP